MKLFHAFPNHIYQLALRFGLPAVSVDLVVSPPPVPAAQLRLSWVTAVRRPSACSTHHREWAADAPAPDGKASLQVAVPELADKLDGTPPCCSRSSNVSRNLQEKACEEDRMHD